MATTLSPVNAREVVRCDNPGCNLVQFRTGNLCRRCHTSLDNEPEIAAPAWARVFPINRNRNGNGDGRHTDLATSIRALRLRNGWSQRELAVRMSVPRTYVSKVENDKAMPTLSSLERLARALKVTIPDLLSGEERHRQEELRELTDDGFVRQLLPFVAKLRKVQMAVVLARVADLTAQQSRCRIVR